MTSVLIAGYYGRRNAGDEAILGGMLAELRAVSPELRICAVSWNPEETRRLHGVDAVPWTDVPGLVNAVRDTSLVIVGGGGLFHDYWGFDMGATLTGREAGIAQFGAPIILARLLGKPSLLYAVGVGPLRTAQGRAWTRDLFAAVDGATVRDQTSLGLLAELGCAVEARDIVADPAFHLPIRPMDPAITRTLSDLARPVLGVALRHWSFGVDPQIWEGEVAAALDAVLEARGGSAIFVPMQDGAHEVEDDVRVSRAVIARMNRRELAELAPPELDPLQRFHLVEWCDLVLAMRLHGVVAGIRGGIPIVALAYDPKVAAMMEAAGLGASCLGPEDWRQESILDRLQTASRASRVVAVAPGRAAGLVMQLLKTEPMLQEAAVRALALDKVEQVMRLESQVAAQEETLDAQSSDIGRLQQRAIEQGLNIETLEGQVAAQAEAVLESRREAERTTLAASLADERRRHAEGELGGIRASRGFRLLWFAWRCVWRLRARMKSVLRAVAALMPIAERGTSLAWATSRNLRPLWLRRLAFASGPGSYIAEDNSKVVLYTNRSDLFPGYVPRKPLTSLGATSAKVTLIATMKNEAASVDRWFADVCGQSRLPDEVIVVDAGSSDGSADRLEALARESRFVVRVLRFPGANIAQGRNAAIRASTYPVIAIADLGCSLSKDWLACLVAPFVDDPATEVVAGWYNPVGRTAVGRSAESELVPRLEDISPDTFLPSARSMAVRREAWERAGGDPEWLTLTGDDTFYDLELKRACPKWAFVPDAVVQWHPPETALGVWRSLYSGARGDGESGVYGTVYWKRGLRLGMVYLAGLTGLLLSGLLSRHSQVGSLLALLGTMAAMSLLGWRLVAHRGIHPVDLLWAIVGQHARAAGYIRGTMDRPAVTARRHKGVAGIRIVLTGVPLDDSGGGQRGAQIAREWLRRGHLVVFVHRFPKVETVELRMPFRHPRLIHCTTAEFDWAAFQWEFGMLLEQKAMVALVEFPIPEFVPLVKAIGELGGTLVYDLIDDWRTSLGGSWYSPRTERAITDACDLLVASAPLLARYLEGITGRQVILLPNAFDPVLFDADRSYPRPTDLPSARPILIYAGSLWGDWFDWELLVRVAKGKPNGSVVVIGDYRGQCPEALPNLHFLGLKRQSELPAYLAHADIGLVPWKHDAVTAATSPLKVYEYMAMGLEVIAPDLEAIPQHRRVHRARTGDEFVAALNEAPPIGMGPASLGSFRQEHSWGARVEELERFVAELGRGMTGARVRKPIEPHGASGEPGMKGIFAHYYATGFWPGPGSSMEYTRGIRTQIPELLRRLGIKIILDAPCGDYGWFRLVPRDPGVRYIGADIVADLVARNQAEHGDGSTEFIHLDITEDALPEADIWLCRDCLFHLSNQDIARTVRNFLRSGITYFMTSTYPESTANTDIATGSFRMLNLEVPPFSFGPPIERIDDWIEGHPVRHLALWERHALLGVLANNETIQGT